jgi:DNA mismatch repair protein MutS
MATRATDTPLMRQYLEIKNQYADALLFFRMGDFFEMFFDDAVVAAEALDLTLTSRDKNKENPIPMCGVPHHAVAGYIRKALERGFKVAICDQVEDPRTARGLVKRAVTRVITPGVVLDTDHLEAKTNNYLATVVFGPKGTAGLAALDLSTFELMASEAEGDGVLDELARLRPKEILYPPDVAERPELVQLREAAGGIWQEGGEALFGTLADDERLVEEKGGAAPEHLGLENKPLAVRACAAALRYAATTQPETGVPACRIIGYSPAQYVQLDEATIANLELFESLMERRRKGSLLWVLDATMTAMGGRLLRRMVGRPLLDVAAIRRRHDAVGLLSEQGGLRELLRQDLRQVYDLERLTSRAVLRVITPRELGRLARSLATLPALVGRLEQVDETSLAREVPEPLRPPADLLQDLAESLTRSLVDDPPAVTKDGGIIRKGHDAKLDELIELSEGGKAQILAIEQRERERTGITSLKIRFNRVFGYFIEVTRAKLDSVPEDYQRKQTLVNAERFITVELADHEAQVLGAEERRIALELELFDALRIEVASRAERLTQVAEWVALLDVLCGLAEVARANDYVRPEVDDGDVISVEDARHPVVERFMAAGRFVPNDLTLDPAEGRLLILTGPNMAGKSTVMRQVALITIMAQLGSFVPARRAQIGVVDRVFTRVGASDNIARGESTFMVEMRETATILRNATARSLVVLDEIGRGTATYDGISIAWAVAEYLHDQVRAKALFATHYHELCALAEAREGVRNFNIAVQEWKGRVVFLRKLVPGGSSRSYGIEVARLAGLERSVVARSRKVLRSLEQGYDDEGGAVPARGKIATATRNQLGLFDASPAATALEANEAAVLEELRATDPETLTPIEALNRLAEMIASLNE